MRTFYTQCACILLFFFNHFSQTSTTLLPIRPQNPPTSLLQPNLSHNLSASNDLTLQENVGNILRTLAAHHESAYHHARIVAVGLKVDDSDPPHLTLSDNVASFRYINCAFNYGDPSASQGFIVGNRWPNHWNEWKAPEPIPFTHLPSFPWQAVTTQMSVEWADALLKLRGYGGRYGPVYLRHEPQRPLGWCFDNVELQDGSSRSVLVSITGNVQTYHGCGPL